MIELLLKKIKNSKYLTVLTGAGISTLSGIPDFRGKNGLWNKYDPFKVFGLDYFLEDPKPFYNFSADFYFILKKAKPNIVHNTLALLEKKGYLKWLFTQNIDGLHTRAGNKNILHLHGNGETAHCVNCGKKFDFNLILEEYIRSKKIPYCTECNGIIKPDVTFFGEQLPDDFIKATEEAKKSDLQLVIGTSLQVAPANTLPEITLSYGGEIIILNLSPTHLDRYAHLVINDDLKNIFESLYQLLTDVT